MRAEAITFRVKRDMAASMALLPAALVLGWLSFRPGLAPFAAASAGTVALLRLLSRSGERPGAGTTLALVIYSALFAIAAVTAREALGLSSGISGGTASGLKDVRAAGEFALFFVLYSATVFEVARTAGAYLGLKKLSPVTALFIFLLYFAVVKLPPYEIDMREWSPLLASAAAVTEGRWPYLHHYSVQHGLMNAGALMFWLKAFEFTPLGLASFVSALTALSGVTAFLLVKRLTNSRGAALLTAVILVAHFHDMETALRTPGLGAAQSHLQIISGLYLVRAALDAGATARGYLHAFVFGALCLWEPVFGVFMALSFAAVMAYRSVSRREQRLFYPVAALMAGVLLPISAAAAIRPPEVDLFSGQALNIFLSTQQVFTSGSGAAPRGFFLWEVLIVVFFAALLMTAYRQASSGRSFSKRQLFLFATALMLPPWLAYRLGSPVPADLSPLAWLLAPSVALIFHTAYRHAALRAGRPRLYATAVITAAPLLTIDLVRPVGADIGGYLTKYEAQRAAWRASCEAAIKDGGRCDPGSGPGLFLYLMAARDKGFGLGAYGPSGFSYYPPNLFLARACEKSVPVISEMDAAIAVQSGCTQPHRFPAALRMEDGTMLSAYLSEIRNFPVVVLDERRTDRQAGQGLLRKIKRELLDSGYSVIERHGAVSVFSIKEAVENEGCIICGPPSEAVKLPSDGGWSIEQPSGAKRKSLGAPSWDSFVFSALVWADGPAGLTVGETGGGYAAFYIDPASGTARLSEFRGKEMIRELSTSGLREKGKGRSAWHEMEVFGSNQGHYQFFVDGEFVLEWEGLKGDAVGLLDLAGTARFREVELARGPEA